MGFVVELEGFIMLKENSWPWSLILSVVEYMHMLMGFVLELEDDGITYTCKQK